MESRSSGENDAPSTPEPLVVLGDPLTGGVEWEAARPFLATALQLVDIELPIGEERAGLPSPEHDERLAEEIVRRDHFPAHLLASSFAAAPAIRLASRHPELVRSLLLHDPIVVFDAPAERTSSSADEVRSQFAPAAHDLESGNLVRAAATLAATWGGDVQDARRILGALSTSDRPAAGWLTQYHSVGRWELRLHPTEEFLAPTLVVTGDLSPPFVRRVATAVTAHFLNVTALELSGATHFDLWRNPARFAGVVLTFCLERNVPVT